MESLDFSSLIIVGVVVSFVVQLIKKYAGTSKLWTMAAVIAFSLLGGSIYVVLKDTAYVQTILQVLISAGAFYTFIIKQFENRD